MLQAQETILFILVIALAAALVAVVVGPKLRHVRRRVAESFPEAPSGDHRAAPGTTTLGRPAGDTSASAGSPTATGIGGPDSPSGHPGLSATLSAGVSSPSPVATNMFCLTCRRRYAPGVRYCPYDARLLIGEGTHPDRTELPSDGEPLAEAAKICPQCSRRYDTAASTCGRDGTELVSVN